MTLTILVLLLCLVLSAVYSGSETGLYSVSRARVDVRARAGRFGARLVRGLLERDSAVLITILIGNNLMLEILAHEGDTLVRALDVAPDYVELCVTLGLTPLVFFFGELLPKDLFRRRPYSLLGVTGAWIGFSVIVFWPLERLLSLVSFGLERLFGVEPRGLVRLRGREAVLSLLDEGAREGTLAPRAGELFANALKLRGTPISKVMVPWGEVEVLERALSGEELFRQVARSRFNRLPLMEEGRVAGYVHAFDVLAARGGQPALEPPKPHPLPSLEPSVSVDRALQSLKTLGKRCALVGPVEAPVGLITVKDLVEEISGELASW